MKFLHVMIRVKDIEKSINFYKNLFNMNVTKEMELSDSKLYFLSNTENNTEIELTYNYETPEEGYTKGTGFGHFAFGVENIEKFEEKMKQNNIKWLYEPFYLENSNLKIAFLNDPDGNEIEIIEEK